MTKSPNKQAEDYLEEMALEAAQAILSALSPLGRDPDDAIDSYLLERIGFAIARDGARSVFIDQFITTDHLRRGYERAAKLYSM
jgi:hypothetical protein